MPASLAHIVLEVNFGCYIYFH